MEKQGADPPGVLTLTTSLSTVCTTKTSSAVCFQHHVHVTAYKVHVASLFLQLN